MGIKTQKNPDFTQQGACPVGELAGLYITRDNAQLPLLSEPCSCWQATATVGSGH